MKRRHAAFLRGINVGKAKRIAMSDLRAVVGGLGYTDVRTLLNSGNVVFTAPASAKGDPAARIEEAIATTLGVSSRVTTRSSEQIDRVVAANPFAKVADDAARYLVGFLSDPADRRKLGALTRENWAPDALALGDGVVYMWCAGGILESPLGNAVGKLLGDAVTSRNWATLLKVRALLADGDAGS